MIKLKSKKMLSNKKFSDFRSDTVTKPTQEMRVAMANAKVGDDVLGDDYTVKKLEKLAAKITGKEKALFVPSGTLGNELAVKLWTKDGEEVILDYKSHIYSHELSGISLIARVLPKPFDYLDGIPDLNIIEKNISSHGLYSFPTTLICMENTHNQRGGAIVPLDVFKNLKQLATKYNIKIHLDGARIFNASIASGIPVIEYCKYVDSIMFCLSKGLSAPVGSMLCGPKKFIMEARSWRRLLGGGMRQSGVLAAAGIIALEKMRDRLADDHKRAKILAQALSKLDGIEINPDKVKTNIVICKYMNNKIKMAEFINKLKGFNVLVLPISRDEIRFVTHKDIDDNDVARAIEACKKIIRERG